MTKFRDYSENNDNYPQSVASKPMFKGKILSYPAEQRNFANLCGNVYRFFGTNNSLQNNGSHYQAFEQNFVQSIASPELYRVQSD